MFFFIFVLLYFLCFFRFLHFLRFCIFVLFCFYFCTFVFLYFCTFVLGKQAGSSFIQRTWTLLPFIMFSTPDTLALFCPFVLLYLTLPLYFYFLYSCILTKQAASCFIQRTWAPVPFIMFLIHLALLHFCTFILFVLNTLCTFVFLHYCILTKQAVSYSQPSELL